MVGGARAARAAARARRRDAPLRAAVVQRRAALRAAVNDQVVRRKVDAVFEKARVRAEGVAELVRDGVVRVLPQRQLHVPVGGRDLPAHCGDAERRRARARARRRLDRRAVREAHKEGRNSDDAARAVVGHHGQRARARGVHLVQRAPAAAARAGRVAANWRVICDDDADRARALRVPHLGREGAARRAAAVHDEHRAVGHRGVGDRRARKPVRALGVVQPRLHAAAVRGDAKERVRVRVSHLGARRREGYRERRRVRRGARAQRARPREHPERARRRGRGRAADGGGHARNEERRSAAARHVGAHV